MITALLHCAERMAQARLIRTKRSQTPGQGGAVHNSPALRPPPYPAKPPPPPPPSYHTAPVRSAWYATPMHLGFRQIVNDDVTLMCRW